MVHPLPSLALRLAGVLLAGAVLGCGQAYDDHAGFTACVSCHEVDRPPNHHEGQDCISCHSSRSWEGGSFDHDQFPIPHHGVSQCDDCHLGGDTTDFSCTDCHEHSAANTNGHHHEVGNYVYESHACYDCHPRGSGEGDDD